MANLIDENTLETEVRDALADLAGADNTPETRARARERIKAVLGPAFRGAVENLFRRFDEGLEATLHEEFRERIETFLRQYASTVQVPSIEIAPDPNRSDFDRAVFVFEVRFPLIFPMGRGSEIQDSPEIEAIDPTVFKWVYSENESHELAEICGSWTYRVRDYNADVIQGYKPDLDAACARVLELLDRFYVWEQIGSRIDVSDGVATKIHFLRYDPRKD